jgi:hypothetical protein
MPRIVGRGAALGLTVAAGVAGGHYLRNDLDAGLVAGAQLGSVAAGMAFAGAWAERRRMTRVAATLSDLAVELATAGTPDIEAAPKLLEVPAPTGWRWRQPPAAPSTSPATTAAPCACSAGSRCSVRYPSTAPAAAVAGPPGPAEATDPLG